MDLETEEKQETQIRIETGKSPEKFRSKKKKSRVQKKEQKISCATRDTFITVIKSESLSTEDEERYVIIDRFKRHIVDNGQGYGYKSEVAAYSAWTWIKRKVRGEL